MRHLKTLSRYLLGLLFIGAGINHFWHTPFYVSMMPSYLPGHLALVYISGAAEMALGALLLFDRWQVIAGWGVIALCIAVFPANLNMALHPDQFSQFSPTALWWRLPLQLLAIGWAYVYTRSGSRA